MSLTEIPNSGEVVFGKSICDIMYDSGIDAVVLLKIDIEGGEIAVFNDLDSEPKILERTKVIAIEVHEECVSKEVIIANFISYKFHVTESGEYLVGYKS